MGVKSLCSVYLCISLSRKPNLRGWQLHIEMISPCLTLLACIIRVDSKLWTDSESDIIWFFTLPTIIDLSRSAGEEWDLCCHRLLPWLRPKVSIPIKAVFLQFLILYHSSKKWKFRLFRIFKNWIYLKLNIPGTVPQTRPRARTWWVAGTSVIVKTSWCWKSQWGRPIL